MPKALSILVKRCMLPFFLIALFVSTASAADVVKNYINKYKPLVAKLSAEYGIPASVIAAIAVVESGAGKSRNCRLLNNHFGIIGKNSLRKKGIKSKFKEYESAEASYRDFCDMVKRKKYYEKLKGNVNYTDWVTAMAKAGYSTQPATWKKMITNTIKKYKLDAAT